MSPTTEQLRIPSTLTLSTRQLDQRSTEELMVVRFDEGRVLAAIQTLRADLLPN